MIELLRQKRNRDELGKIHPAFVLEFAAVVRELETLGYRPRLQETYRDLAAQAKKFAEGKSEIKGAGPHTNVILLGPGKSRPASLATHVLDDDAKNPADPGNAWIAILAVTGARYGLQTGAVWAQSKASVLLPGKPHRIMLEAAIAGGDEPLVKKLLDEARGFDPLHLEIRGWRRYYGVDLQGQGA